MRQGERGLVKDNSRPKIWGISSEHGVARICYLPGNTRQKLNGPANGPCPHLPRQNRVCPMSYGRWGLRASHPRTQKSPNHRGGTGSRVRFSISGGSLDPHPKPKNRITQQPAHLMLLIASPLGQAGREAVPPLCCSGALAQLFRRVLVSILQLLGLDTQDRGRDVAPHTCQSIRAARHGHGQRQRVQFLT